MESNLVALGFSCSSLESGIELENELNSEPGSLRLIPERSALGLGASLRLDPDGIQLRSFASSSSRTSFQG
jgi:hypothetical protein